MVRSAQVQQVMWQLVVSKPWNLQVLLVANEAAKLVLQAVAVGWEGEGEVLVASGVQETVVMGEVLLW